jgi:hypothetical protein
VPYADLTNPQSLNLYGYVTNNPLSDVDPDGHIPCNGGASATITVTPNGSSMSQSADDCPTTDDLFQFGWQNRLQISPPTYHPPTVSAPPSQTLSLPLQAQKSSTAPNKPSKFETLQAFATIDLFSSLHPL